jgi:hypothetical protein
MHHWTFLMVVKTLVVVYLRMGIMMKLIKLRLDLTIRVR